jgi:DNA-binding NtrC family response regulator
MVVIEALWKTEKRTIETAIDFCEGNIPKAAAMLDISPSTIYRKKQSWADMELK